MGVFKSLARYGCKSSSKRRGFLVLLFVCLFVFVSFRTAEAVENGRVAELLEARRGGARRRAVLVVVLVDDVGARVRRFRGGGDV